MHIARMTDEDIRIHSRLNWAMFNQSMNLPSNQSRIADSALNISMARCMVLNGISYLDHNLLAFWKAETWEY